MEAHLHNQKRGVPVLRLSAFLAVAMAAGSAEAATWYVATGGNDSSVGSSAAPFRSWQRAIDRAQPGDTIAIRPGVYAVAGARDYGVRILRSGTRAAPITLRGQGGQPILDCGGISYNASVNCLLIKASWWRIADLGVRGAKQLRTQTYPSGVLMQDSSDNVLDNVASYGHQGTGIRVTRQSANNLIHNCDVHHNSDIRHPSGPGHDADGMSLSYLSANATGNRVVGCRAWSNGDDGIDLWGSEAGVTIENSWSYWNGYVPGTKTTAGNGVGFKLGSNSLRPQHVIVRNLAFENRSTGFADNGASGAMRVTHNTAFNNGSRQFQFLGSVRHYLRNNVAVPATNQLSSSVDQAMNSWSIAGVRADSSDFRSVSSAGFGGSTGGSRLTSDLVFLRLASGSDLIDRGTDLGMPFTGAAPDLGAYEAGRAALAQKP